MSIKPRQYTVRRTEWVAVHKAPYNPDYPFLVVRNGTPCAVASCAPMPQTSIEAIYLRPLYSARLSELIRERKRVESYTQGLSYLLMCGATDEEIAEIKAEDLRNVVKTEYHQGKRAACDVLREAGERVSYHGYAIPAHYKVAIVVEPCHFAGEQHLDETLRLYGLYRTAAEAKEVFDAIRLPQVGAAKYYVHGGIFSRSRITIQYLDGL